MSAVATVQGLTPEQSRAFSVFLDAFQNFNELTCLNNCLSLEYLTVTGTTFFTTLTLKTKTLPRGTDWLWNQSRSRKYVSINNVQLCFYKLNTRKVNKNSDKLSPLCKIWLFNVTTSGISESKSLSFFWCEKGFAPPPVIEITPVLLSDLAFLHPFINSCGWETESFCDTLPFS